MNQWEYRQVSGPLPEFETDLNALGSEGWELAFVTAVPGTSPLQLLAILKRGRGLVSETSTLFSSEPVRTDANDL